jgi:hypothetical protein
VTELAKIETEQQLPADPLISMIERVATDPNASVETLTALMDMRERQMNKEAEQVFNRAFAEAMAEMPNVKRTGENKHLRTKYSTLDDLIQTTRPVLSRHGLSLNWQTKIDANTISVTATVRHAEGHLISTTLSGPRDTGKQMNTLQGGGSTETYLKRYSGFGILGLSSGDEADDDGQGAQLITAEQLVTLRDLVEASGADQDKFLLAYKADSLEQFPAKMFEAACAQLRRKMEQSNA